MTRCIAERKLLFSPKGSGQRKPFTVRILAPRELQAGDVAFTFTEGTAECTVQIEGLPEPHEEKVCGADTLQALELAVNVEPLLKRISKKYDLYFPTGEGYFEE